MSTVGETRDLGHLTRMLLDEISLTMQSLLSVQMDEFASPEPHGEVPLVSPHHCPAR